MADHVLESKPRNYGAIPKVISIPNKNIWPWSAEQTCLNASEIWTILCRELLCRACSVRKSKSLQSQKWWANLHDEDVLESKPRNHKAISKLLALFTIGESW